MDHWSGTESTAILTGSFWDEVRSDGGKLALKHVEYRMLETAVLADPSIRDVARYWEMHLGCHEDVVRARLDAIGVAPTDAFVRFIVGCLDSWHARKSRREAIDPETEREVFERYRVLRGSQLRCEVCGYHFLEDDLNSRRAGMSSEAGLELGTFLHPGREIDDLKPISSTGMDRHFTGLEIDHIVPQVGLGSSRSVNLALLCRFCNLGKSGYLHPLEGLSDFIASSLVSAYNTTPGAPGATVCIVACLRQSGGVCEVSGGTVSEVELSVRPRSGSKWLVPWKLQPVSYAALAES